jgi:hypothetical protein
MSVFTETKQLFRELAPMMVIVAAICVVIFLFALLMTHLGIK